MAPVGRLEYFIHDDQTPVVMIHMEDGGLDCWVLDFNDGDFKRNLGFVTKVLLDSHAPSDSRSRPDFIQDVEEIRGERVIKWRMPCAAPVVALYESIEAIDDQARAERRRPTSEERALIRELRGRSHELFEAELRARGGHGMPTQEWTREIPASTGPATPPPEWRAVPDGEVADIARRLAGLGDRLRDGDSETVAAALGWPIVETTPAGQRLDARLPLTKGSVWLERDGTGPTVEVPLTDPGREQEPSFARFLNENFERAGKICQSTYALPRRETSGRWPELSWRSNGVGVFLRRGSTCVMLLAMPEANASARYDTVNHESQWDG